MTLRIYDDLDQGTPEWLAARRGIVTASVVGKLITTGSPDPLTVVCPTCNAPALSACLSLAATKGAPKPIKTIHEGRSHVASQLPPVYVVADNDTSRGLTLTLAAERISKRTDETPMTADMWRGVEHEPYAREEYAKHHARVKEIGLMVRTEDDWTLGYSPDGLVGNDGLLEIKAPRTKGHVLSVVADEVPGYYMAQCQAGLLVSGRKWIDFFPFVGGQPLWKKRIYPDPAWQDAIVAACVAFEENAARTVNAYIEATTNLPVTERVPDLEMVL